MTRHSTMAIAIAGLMVAAGCQRTDADTAPTSAPVAIGAAPASTPIVTARPSTLPTRSPAPTSVGDITISTTSGTRPPAAATIPPIPTSPASTLTTPASTTTTSTMAPTTLPPTTLPPATTVARTESPTTDAAAVGDRGSIHEIRPPSDLPAPPLPAGWTTQVLGTSVNGRDITALVRPVEAPTKGVLVIGGIHGNEPASPPTVRAFVDASYADDVAVWLVPELNPDGVAAGTRWNANDVDLNRNFPWDWRASTGGPAPLSEPESRAISDFISAVRPGVVVWVHQPLGYVSSVGGTTRALEAAWSDASGLRTRSGVTQHGGGESWTHFDAGLPSMLIEIDTWADTTEIVAAQLNGFQQLLVELGWAGAS